MRNPMACIKKVSDFVSNPGSAIHVLYAPKVSRSGKIELVVSGEEDTDVIIQEQAKFCDISVIISRLRHGDTSMLRDGTPMYGSFLDAPKTLAESLQMVIDAERSFNALPVDVRKEFNNNFREWVLSAGSDDFMVKHKFDKVEKSDPVESEVASND